MNSWTKQLIASKKEYHENRYTDGADFSNKETDYGAYGNISSLQCFVI